MNYKQIHKLRDKLNESQVAKNIGESGDDPTTVAYDCHGELVTIQCNDQSIVLTLSEVENLRKYFNKLLS